MIRLGYSLLVCLVLGSCSEPAAPTASRDALRITALTPLEQTAPLESGVSGATRPRVRVTDAAGNPVRAERVTFRVTRGQPTIVVHAALTDAAGEAWISQWGTGTLAGVQEVTAILATNTSDTRAVFRVNVPAGPPVTVGPDRASISVAVGDSSRPLAIVRWDVHGNVVDTLAGTTISSDEEDIVAITANGAARAVSPGRTTVLLKNGTARYGVVVVAGGVATRTPIDIPSNPDAGYALAMAPSGLAYAVGFSEDVDLDLHRIAAGAQVASTIAWAPGVTRILDAAFSPDGTRAYFTAQFTGLVVVDATTDAVLGVVNLPHEAQRVAVTPDGAYVVVTGPGQFTRVATSDMSLVTFDLPWFDLTEATNGIAMHPSLPTVYLASTTGFVAAIDYLSGAVLQSVVVDGRPQGLALDVARSRLIVARQAEGLRVLHAGTLAHEFDSMRRNDNFDVRYDAGTDAVWVTRPSTGSVDRYTHSLTTPAEQIGVPDPRRLGIRPDGSVLVSARFGVRLIPAP